MRGTTEMINPIETHYAGCRFRSRLEARYAVFFDTLGIRWEYEREGYQVSDRLSLLDHDKDWCYLPDFWLPDHELHVEVKGQFDSDGLRKFLSAAALLSAPYDGCATGCRDGNDTLLLGPIPRVDRPFAYPIRLHMHKGDLQDHPWDGSRKRLWCAGYGSCIANDCGNIRIDASDQTLLNGRSAPPDPAFRHAYTAARSARFEHGEKG
jgi:hypothetical protein